MLKGLWQNIEKKKGLFLIIKFTSSKSSRILLKSASCSIMDLDFVILKKYNCCFKQSLLAKLFVIYKDSRLAHIAVTVFTKTQDYGSSYLVDHVVLLLL